MQVEPAPPPPSPALLFETINAYQRTAAIKAGIELDVFTAMADGPVTAEVVAGHCGGAVRGVRILCDYLTTLGFLGKSGGCYALTPDSAVFLDRRSPAYAGGTIDFLLSSHLTHPFDQLTAAARQGGTAHSRDGTIAPEHPVWISFARSMGPLMAPAAVALTEVLPVDADRPCRILDVSASHGAWGIAFARRHPLASVVALDWEPVLAVARENAGRAGIGDRFATIAGDAFEADLGGDYDLVLVPNFLHHFNPEDCVRFLRRVHGALRPEGTVAIVEFVPNEDRVTSPGTAAFSLVMLATTPEGDAYTLEEYASMLREAGFEPPVQHPLPMSMNVVVKAVKGGGAVGMSPDGKRGPLGLKSGGAVTRG